MDKCRTALGSTSPHEHAPLLKRDIRSTSDEVAVEIAPPEVAASPRCQTPRGSKQSVSSASCSASSSSLPASVIGTCRICFDQETPDSQDSNNPLISPCQCSGSSKYVHRQCLQQWRETNHRADAYYQCEVCKYRYQYRRMWWASILGSNITLTVLFIIIMSACVGLLGFVPITNGLFSSSSSSSGGGSSSAGGDPAAGGSGSDPGSSSSSGLTAQLVMIHIFNGIVMMGIVGLVVSVLLTIGRALGLPTLALMPDPFCPCCIWCLELNSNGAGSAPLIGECIGASGGECCIALVAVVAVVMLVMGIVLAAYMLYIVLWVLVQAGLSRAQHMVENVQQEKGAESSSKPPPQLLHV